MSPIPPSSVPEQPTLEPEPVPLVSLQETVVHEAPKVPVEQQTNQHENDKDKQCLEDLCATGPFVDKDDIETKKGGLLSGSYQWVLEHKSFQQFQKEEESQVLWVKGDTGKGKTMLLCGIIEELKADPSVSLSYFFFQATDGDKLNTATPALRGLIYHLASCNPQLIKHIREKYDAKGKAVFYDENAWHNLCDIMTAMLNDPSLKNAILVIDALDECGVGRQHLLDFISKPSPAKWIVSSHDLPDVEESLYDPEQKAKIHLELDQASVSAAVESYVDYRVERLAEEKNYDPKMKTAILEVMKENSQGTFLWVALVCQELSVESVRRRHSLTILSAYPTGLDPLYKYIMEQLYKTDDARLCKDILDRVLAAPHPIPFEQLRNDVHILTDLEREEVEEIISSCGSLLVLHRDAVSYVHQSARDYLLNKAPNEIPPLEDTDDY
ncbi:Vegetative incompatibility protein HET-E-1 [Ceratocystis platani]|uniref:Vegetative incompatibility protein HET-E-1 n=1 Tax=Ceratocystis fimbriata f. sp. platani TaxID=88771 RepID=A0A0F8CW65_CERFI|nr:Vegetative incompatibility protein HET-E-1 [Ceratocystis platani]